MCLLWFLGSDCHVCRTVSRELLTSRTVHDAALCATGGHSWDASTNGRGDGREESMLIRHSAYCVDELFAPRPLLRACSVTVVCGEKK